MSLGYRLFNVVVLGTNSFFSFFFLSLQRFYSYNSDGLSLMDVAVLTNNTEMVKLLIQHGAREGMECKLLFLFLLTCSIINIFPSLSLRAEYQMAVKNRLVCISFNYSTTLRNNWKRKVSRRLVRSESSWKNTSPCGSAECASSAK